MSLDKSDFEYWKSNSITKLIYQKLTDLDNHLKDVMLNPSVMLELEGQLRYARAAGSRDVVREYLDLQFEDLEIDNEEQKDNEETL